MMDVQRYMSIPAFAMRAPTRRLNMDHTNTEATAVHPRMTPKCTLADCRRDAQGRGGRGVGKREGDGMVK